jgi:hypothetical protein
MLGITIAIIVILLILWVYYVQFRQISTDGQIFLTEIEECNLFRTGDLILFKAFNNINSLVHGSYFGHVGIIYAPNDGPPLLFEANGVEKMPLLPHHSRSGIFLTPVYDRIKKYKGRCYWKPLNKQLPRATIAEFTQFIRYCLSNFSYDHNVIANGFKLALGLKKCDKKTDCGQIVFLSLIKLGLIDIEEYEKNKLHYLKYVTNINELTAGYKYSGMMQIIDHPFAD